MMQSNGKLCFIQSSTVGGDPQMIFDSTISYVYLADQSTAAAAGGAGGGGFGKRERQNIDPGKH